MDTQSMAVTSGPTCTQYFLLYLFRFKDLLKPNGTFLLHVTSHDDFCMVVSVQNYSCSVYVLHQRPEVSKSGLYQTADTVAAITFAGKNFPDGAFMVMAVHPDGRECGKASRLHNTLLQFTFRQKNVTFSIERRISENKYLLVMVSTVLGVVISYMIIPAVFLVCLICECRRNETINSQSPYNIELPENGAENLEGVEDATVSVPPAAGDTLFEHSSMEERNFFRLLAPETDGDINTTLYVSDPAPEVLDKKYYIWHNVLSVALLYGLPVVQLSLTYDNVATGNLDRCFYNFLCANPLGIFQDFNHLFSNIGYIMLGVGFWIHVWLHDVSPQREVSAVTRGRLDQQHLGLPRHLSVDYALGLALMAEGLMSACYHVCPNRTNFQFDTAFMYVISCLVLLKMYQARCQDIFAEASKIFLALAILIFIASIGMLTYISWMPLFIIVVFGIIQVIIYYVLSTQIYYVGRCSLHARLWQLAWVIPMRALCAHQRVAWSRSLLGLLLVNTFNGSLVVCVTILLYYKVSDFGSALLVFFIFNIFSYTVYYVYKKRRLERVKWQPYSYAVVASLVWLGALGCFFFKRSSSWVHSPAHSREKNEKCFLFDFYDHHDAWHLLSALGMFLTFMFLLTLDDDLHETPRDQIIVF